MRSTSVSSWRVVVEEAVPCDFTYDQTLWVKTAHCFSSARQLMDAISPVQVLGVCRTYERNSLGETSWICQRTASHTMDRTAIHQALSSL